MAGAPKRFLAGVVSTNLADGVLVSALPLGIAAAAGSPSVVALGVALVWTPAIAAFAVGGRALDRHGALRVAVAVQVARATVLFGLAAGEAMAQISPVVIGLAGGAVVAGEFLFDSALEVLVGRSTEQASLARAFGRLRSAELLGNRLVGPAIGGVLVHISPVAAYLAAGALVATALLLVMRAPGDLASATQNQTRPVRTHRMLQRITEGPLLGLMVLSVSAALGVGMSSAMMVIRVIEETGHSATAYGIIQSGSAVGGILAGVVAGGIVGLGRPRAALLSYAAIGVSYLVIAGTDDIEPFLVATIIFGAGAMLFGSYAAALRQAVVADEFRGQVTATFRAVSMLAIPVGALAAAPIAATWDAAAAFAVAGVVQLTGAVLVTVLRLNRGAFPDPLEPTSNG